MPLSRGKLLRLEPGVAGRRVVCRFGTVWLTLEGDVADYVLEAGDEISLPQDGLVLVQAISDSTVEALGAG